MALRKTAEQRSIEFVSKSIIIKKFGNISLSKDQEFQIKVFFDNWLANNKKEISDGLYITLYRLLLAHPTKDLWEQYCKLQLLKTNTIEHSIILFGIDKAHIIYNNRNKQISEKITYKPSQYVDAFLKLKCVSTVLKKNELSIEQLHALEKLLIYKKYNIQDNELIISDIIRTHDNYQPDVIERFNTVKSLSRSTIKYFKARYGNIADAEYDNYLRNQRNTVNRNFPNLLQHWLDRGYNEQEAKQAVSNHQKECSSKNTCKVTCRTAQFWIDRGHDLIQAAENVRKIQTRDINFFITKYGENDGIKKYDNMIDQRSFSWNNWSDEKRYDIYKRKGRTREQLIHQHGIEEANRIISSRLPRRVSQESKTFFQSLDEMLDLKISRKSVTGYKTPEFFINSGSCFYLVDYKLGNCIIEYNGSYWHADPRKFNENDILSWSKKIVSEIWQYDNQKIKTLELFNYKVLVIWSDDVKRNKEAELKKCKEFLNEHYKYI